MKDAITITIANNKGGTGKTTTAINFGAALARRGYSVLLIDFDGQYNLTSALRVPTDAGTTYDLMTRPSVRIAPARVVCGSASGALDVLPSSRDLSAMETELSAASDRMTRLSAVLGHYRHDYDIIVIDTPPALGLLSIAAIYATDEMVVTASPSYLSVRGLLSIADVVSKVAENRKTEIPSRILFTRFDRRKNLHRLTVEQVRKAGFAVFDTSIRENISLDELASIGADVFSYAPKSNGATDYADFAEEWIREHKANNANNANIDN